MQNHVVFLGNEKPLHRLLIPQAKENEILNVKNEVHIMENTMESQKVERWKDARRLRQGQNSLHERVNSDTRAWR